MLGQKTWRLNSEHTVFLLQQKHPAGLTTALVVIHFFQNRKILNHKNVVFTEAKWRFFTVSISGESKKQPEKASRILGPFSQNAARVAFFARPFFWSLSSCSRDGFAKLLSQILVSIAPAPLPLAQMAHQGRSVFWRERWRYTHLAKPPHYVLDMCSSMYRGSPFRSTLNTGYIRFGHVLKYVPRQSIP